MAITVGAVKSYITLNLKFHDAQHQVRSASLLLDQGSDSDAGFLTNLLIFMGRLDTLSNAAVYGSFSKLVTTDLNTDTVGETAQNFATIDQVLALMFTRQNPLKTNLKLNATFPIMAYKVNTASEDFPNAGIPKVSDANVAGVISFLEQ